MPARTAARAVVTPPRRVSGPARPRALPASAPVPPLRRGGTWTFERIRALPDHRLVDGLLRSRGWIWVVGLLLGGIVAMQVSLLKLNAGISRLVETTATLQRQNADLESSLAKLTSGGRIQAAATEEGMIDPSAGTVRYLRVRPGYDVAGAVHTMTPPSPVARLVMGNGGRLPAGLLPPGTLPGADTAGAPSSGTAPGAATGPAAAPTTTTPGAGTGPAATPTTPGAGTGPAATPTTTTPALATAGAAAPTAAAPATTGAASAVPTSDTTQAPAGQG